MYLPGGGARDGAIVVDDKDEDDPDDLDSPDDDDEADDEPPAAPPRRQARPTYKELLEENSRLAAATRRNNSENAKHRKVAEWLRKNGIDDVDQLTAGQLADMQKATGEPPPAAAVTSEAPPAAQQPTPVAQPAGEPPKPVVDDAEIERRVQLALEKNTAQVSEKASVLEKKLRLGAIETALTKLGFAGTVDKAMRVLDQTGIAVTEDGEVTGAAEAAQALREEIPEWFRRRSATPTPPTVTGGADMDGGEKRPRQPKPATWETQVADRLQRGR
jgi:hypothetical protein